MSAEKKIDVPFSLSSSFDLSNPQSTELSINTTPQVVVPKKIISRKLLLILLVLFLFFGTLFYIWFFNDIRYKFPFYFNNKVDYVKLELTFNEKMAELRSILDENNFSEFDETKAIAICKSENLVRFYPLYVDMCLEQISKYLSRHSSDVAFCDRAGFFSAHGDDTYKERCKENFLFKSGKYEDCLKLRGSSVSYCLSQYVQKEKSLQPCMLVDQDDISVCISSMGNFKSLDQISDCTDFKKYMTDLEYDNCLYNVGINTRDAKVCESVVDMGLVTCVEFLAYDLSDPSICEYFDSIGSTSKFCKSSTPDGRNIDTESAYLAYCSSYSDDNIRGIVDKSNCFTDLAVNFNKPDYCHDAATINTKKSADSYTFYLDSCYKRLIIEKSRVDLCNLVTSQNILDSREYKNVCQK
jgi:hypothetical protein